MTVFGVVLTLRDLGFRLIPLGLLAVVYAMVAFSVPSIFVLVVILAALLACAYFLSPARAEATSGATKGALRMATRAQAEAEGEAAKWRQSVPLARIHRRLTDLAESLHAIVDNSEARRAGTTGTSAADNFIEEVAAISAEFEVVRPELVRLVQEVRAQYGLAHKELTDEKLCATIYGPKQTRDLIDGLNEIAAHFGEMLIKSTESQL